VDWSPSDVCLLAGPNGSGKSSLLQALRFPRSLFTQGLTQALQSSGGADHLRRVGAEDDAPVALEVVLGEVAWQLEIPVEGLSVNPYHGERLLRDGEPVLEARRYETTIRVAGQVRERDSRGRCGLRTLWDREEPAWLRPFIDLLGNIRIHHSYWLNQARRPDPQQSLEDQYLHPTGRNLWAVLRKWKAAARQFDHQYEWVMDQAVRAFPELMVDLEFPPEGPRMYLAGALGPQQSLPVHLAADGLLVGLMHLTALAGAPAGAVLAFDEMENQLHPHAIRSLLAAMRARAEERDLTIVLTTHSPVLMNEFNNYADSFYVFDPTASDDTRMPTPLTIIKDPKWLRHFSLGDLYEREKFAAPGRSDAGS